ncbi:methyltransferase [Trichoderma harzianum]|uniref:phosphoethanolamine N-methyltransferase n=1 Tax=Trichoderma harzianum TaxID=5544 RepID=A0A0G0A3H4_TRIHA|nr:methyltransferase [Trichoderma harzianum]
MGDNSNVNKPVGDMALYNLERANRRLDALQGKPTWDLEDTADFDCMHYLGNSALENAGQTLGMQQGQTVVDIGAGFSATGRYLHKRYGVDVTGIELQPEIHQLAETITQRNGLSESVRSVNADFTKLSLDTPVDYIVSFLCILHIPDRGTLFQKAASTLKSGGKIYIEDFFAQTSFSKDAGDQLRDVLFCPYLPSRDQYKSDLTKAGFHDVQFEDMSEEWTEFVHERALDNRQKGTSAAPLTLFYDTVDALFSSRQLGGARITATKA